MPVKEKLPMVWVPKQKQTIQGELNVNSQAFAPKIVPMTTTTIQQI
jgi:phosphoribosylcarboxyaminoimidazole (NCAIR) mutase